MSTSMYFGAIIKRVFLFILSITLMVSIVYTKENVYADSKNIVNHFKDKDVVNDFCNEFLDLIGYYASEKDENIYFDFTEKDARQEAIRFSYSKHGKLSASEQNKLSKQLFGKGVSKVEQVMGEWGCSYPVLELSKIYKLSEKKYKVKLNIYFDSDDDGREKKGNALLIIKKNPKAKYGYYFVNLKISK